MTGLGASIYLGFFALAALWLFVTADGPLSLTGRSRRQDQRAERSNSDSFEAEADASSPWLVSHSSLK
jgi:hypothetical protein